MTTAIKNFYSDVIRNFTKDTNMEYIGKNYLSGKVSFDIMEAILMYDLEVVDTENFFVQYKGRDGITVEIRHTGRHYGINEYKVEINSRIHTEVPEELLNDLIIEELRIPQ